ncbi:MAG TPA: M1 family metallopeptidase [Planctomycetota bacterium]|nr:M1 family metallopeptidase [Planctomycetota bacterium]
MRIAVIAACLAACCAGIALAGCGRDRRADDLAEVALDLIPAERGLIAEHDAAPFYRIDATIDPTTATVRGSLRTTVTNTAREPWPRLWFRLQPNAPQYLAGAMTVTKVRAGGRAAASELRQDATTLAIDLARPLPPGERVDVAMDFISAVPAVENGFGILRSGPGWMNLYGWHPTLAPCDDGEWILHDIAPLAEPTNTAVANYLVEVTAPAGWIVVATGSGPVPPLTPIRGAMTWRYRAALARNFVVVAATGLESHERQVGATLVTSYAPRAHAAGARLALDAAAESLALFAGRLGPYPYTELDVVHAELGDEAGGMESTGLVTIASAMYARPGALETLAKAVGGGAHLDELDLVVAHEVAHQWFYGLVGSDSNAAPWLDESLASWAGVWFVQSARDAKAGAEARSMQGVLPYRMARMAVGDQPLHQHVAELDEIELGGFVYGKGTLLYERLRGDLGDERFFAFLADYVRRHRFARADLAGWRRCLAAVAGEEYADGIIARWIRPAD